MQIHGYVWEFSTPSLEIYIGRPSTDKWTNVCVNIQPSHTLNEIIHANKSLLVLSCPTLIGPIDDDSDLISDPFYTHLKPFNLFFSINSQNPLAPLWPLKLASERLNNWTVPHTHQLTARSSPCLSWICAPFQTIKWHIQGAHIKHIGGFDGPAQKKLDACSTVLALRLSCLKNLSM